MGLIRKIIFCFRLAKIGYKDLKIFAKMCDRLDERCKEFDSFYQYWDFLQSIPRNNKRTREIIFNMMEKHISNFHQCVLVLDEISDKDIFERMLKKALNLCMNRDEQDKLKILIAVHGFDGSKTAHDIMYRRVKKFVSPKAF